MSELRRQVRAFLARELAEQRYQPHCDSWLSSHDPAFSSRLAMQGWVGMTIPAAYGGGGRSYLERYMVLEELLAAGAPVAAHWIADRQTGPLLLRYGTEAQRQRFLPGIARGEVFFAIGMSEPDSGSDLASVRTSATRVDGGWQVNGSKVWTSHAHRSHFMITLVRTAPPAERKHEGLSQLLIDLHAPGVTVNPIELLSGEPHFSEVVFDRVFVPDGMLVGVEGGGWKQVNSELAFERSGPERFLSTFPLLADTVREVPAATSALGELIARLRALRALAVQLAGRLQAGEEPLVEAALLKDMGTKFEQDTVEVARRLVPPAGAAATWRRLYSEAVTHAPGFTLRGGTSEILRGIVTRALVAGDR